MACQPFSGEKIQEKGGLIQNNNATPQCCGCLLADSARTAEDVIGAALAVGRADGYDAPAVVEATLKLVSTGIALHHDLGDGKKGEIGDSDLDVCDASLL